MQGQLYTLRSSQYNSSKMKILIVNAHPPNPKGQKDFLEFRYLVQKSFLEQNELVDTETEFIIRDATSVIEFLYEIPSSWVNQNAIKAFNNFDMVFVSGCGTILPWSPFMERVLVLLRMCLRVKKCLFASGSAMQCLVFLSASNFDRTVYMINHPHEETIPHHFSTANNQQNLKYYVDKITGDIYTFSQEAKQWIPKVNAGLHNNSAAQSYQTLGKYILKVPTYRPKQEISQNSKSLFISKNTEIIVQLKIVHLNHPAFEGLTTPKFLASTTSKWDVHTFSFPSEEKVFTVLAESDRGPVVIEYGIQILSTLFSITQRYPESVIPLKNFIRSSIFQISAGMKREVSVPGDKMIKMRVPKIRDQNMFLLLRGSASLNQLSPEDEKGKFKHSGYAVKKTGERQFFKNNQISEKGKIFFKKKGGEKTLKGNSEVELESLEFPESAPKTEELHQRSVSTMNQEEIRCLLHPKLNLQVSSLMGEIWVPGQYSLRRKQKDKRILVGVKKPFTNFLKFKNSCN